MPAASFDRYRPYLIDYLHSKGINPSRRFSCLNPDHTDRNPSMGYDPRRQKVHCFACGADYDLFDLLRLDEQLTTAGEALHRAEELYGPAKPKAPSPTKTLSGGQTPPTSNPAAKAITTATEPDCDSPTKIHSAQAADLPHTYLTDCFSHRGETDYFHRRGLSDTTVDRFLLGYDPGADCVVLPCAQGHFVRRSTREKRYLNEKGLPSPLFQPELLAGPDPVFLVEGAFDALSAEDLGFRAAALNGAGNREKAAELLRALSKPVPIFLLPDQDAAGETWASALLEEFPWLYRCEPLPTGKDLNELLQVNREQAAAYLSAAQEEGLAHQPPPYGESSAAGQMPALARYIQEMAARPALKTGFSTLDTALDGGLYDGLYVLGAVSSLGKTAFAMQMADQLARQGRDVLIFSLEMTAYELMARSISRETFVSDGSTGKKLSKTIRGVLDGKRYARYTTQEHAHLQNAVTAYEDYARHLFFREGDHETGLDFIQREIVRHITETGVKPVVLIDYLQIIAPVDVHFTDKQNLDRVVCGLKKLARTHSLTIFAISSFNRENYNLEVSMSAFKESGGIDYSADVLLGLQARGAGSRSFNVDEEKRRDPRELELKILKNRSAALGEPLPLRYYPAYSYFEEPNDKKLT